MITVQINGEARQLPEDASVRTLVTAQSADRPGLAVAVNGHVAPRDAWDRTLLCDGDEVLLVRPAAGG